MVGSSLIAETLDACKEFVSERFGSSIVTLTSQRLTMLLLLAVYMAGTVYSSETITIKSCSVEVANSDFLSFVSRRRFRSSFRSFGCSSFLKFRSCKEVFKEVKTYSSLQFIKSISAKSFHLILWPLNNRQHWDDAHTKFSCRRHSFLCKM